MPHITVRDGTRIFYRDAGRGRPILLLHGMMAHGGFFDRQSPLADDFRLIAVDLRGHGRSPADPAALSVGLLAGDVAELVTQLDLQGAIGVGWSLGASILWRLLSGKTAGRFAGAVIVDMTPKVLNEGDWTLGLSRELCEARRQAMMDDYSGFAQAVGTAIFSQPLADGIRPWAAWAGAEFARNDAAAISAIWSSLVEDDARPLLPAIRQPTLIVRGAHSQLYGAATAEHLVRALPNARAATLPQSGHAPHLEEPDRFNALLRDFAASLPPVLQPLNA